MKLAQTSRQSALRRAFSSSSLSIVWELEKRRLKASCFGVDRISGKEFGAEKSWRIPSIKQRRLDKGFVPSPLLAIAKPKAGGGHRIICVPTIEDRLIQFSILSEIRDSLKSRGLLNDVSYGLVAQSNRTVQDARKRAASLREQGAWIYKADIQKFFDRIPREFLEMEIRQTVRQRSLHDVLISFSKVEIGDGFANDWQEIVQHAGIRAGLGVRQGMPLSPYFAGILLLKLDKFIEKKRLPVIRYVDDIIGFFRSESECLEFNELIISKLKELSLEIGLINSPHSKTKIFSPEEPADFVGMEMSFGHQGRCELRVSEKTILSIEDKFSEMSNIDNLLQKKITLPFLGSRLESMANGYIAAYHGAENMTDLKSSGLIPTFGALDGQRR